jgi:hypothetical protein
MTSGILVALAFGAIAVGVLYGLFRQRSGRRAGGDSPNTVAQWTEGETTRLLSSAELPGLYLLRPRFLSKAENVVYLLLKAAFPRHDIFARVRLADVLQVKIGPQGMERLRAFRKIANQHVGFVVCDRGMTIVAIVDAKEPQQVQNPRDQKLEIIKQRCLQAAQVKYLCVYPPTLPRYRDLREQVLGPAAELV